MRRLLLLACAAALVGAATTSAASPVSATMVMSSTRPVVEVPWRYTITVRSPTGHHPLAARARLEILRGARLVGCWRRIAIVPCTRAEIGTWIPFTGRRTGAIVWPSRWVGRDLTFRVVVVTGIHTLLLRTPVTVLAAP